MNPTTRLFEGVQSGHRVHLTASDGREITAEVSAADIPLNRLFLRKVGTVCGSDWDTCEILPEPLPTKPGYYLEKFEAGYALWYLSNIPLGGWVKAGRWDPLTPDERSDLVFLGDKHGNRS